jgi:hypothetical protein
MGKIEQQEKTEAKVTRIAGTETEADYDVRLAESLKLLKANVPDLPAALKQLSLFAKHSPIKFKLYMATLMSMKFK